jgi:flagellar hook-associated protein 2
MAGMSVDGLVSGLDTTNLINQLISAEGASQTALKTRLTATEQAASAYRTVNTTFLAITSAAEKLTPDALVSARTASSSSSAVAATATASSVPGSSVTFSVQSLASTQVSLSRSVWTSATADARGSTMAWPIEILDENDVSVGTVDIPAGATLTDAAKAINDAGHGLTASVVKLGGNRYTLQLTSTTAGEAGGFTITSAGEDATTLGSGFVTTAPAQDAVLDLGGGVVAKSASNIFPDLLTGLSVTVSKVDPEAQVTVSVGTNNDAVATNVQRLVDAVNAAINTVKDYTNNSKGSTAALRGDYSITSLGSKLLDAISFGVTGHGSPAQAGFELTKDGRITFDKTAFLTALKDKPEMAQALVLGTAAGTAEDGTAIPAVQGVAARLLEVAKSASDTTTGTLGSMATGKDSTVKDLKARIEAWDLRLEKRREMLTRQFTAMETALSSMKNQSTWLGSQLSALG